MILEIDVGNSRIKWRQLAAGKVINAGIVPGAREFQKLTELAIRPNAIRACSVRKGEAYNEVKDWLESKYDMPVHSAQVKRDWGGVGIQYEDPSRLGVDRWLAMLAAYSLVRGACIIVDAGTALTIDVVAAGGAHKGGYILPGLALMGASLEQNTAIRLATPAQPASLVLGHSTDQAVWNGGLAAAVALIEKIALGASGQKAVHLLLSGGDAEVLAANTDFERISGSKHYNSAGVSFEVVPDLVLNGLCIAFPLPGGDPGLELS